jgi:Uma2 family endonuclease
MERMQHGPSSTAPPEHWPREDRDQIVVLRSVSWSDYLAIDRARGERSQPHIAYLDGVVELVTTSRRHEHIKTLLARLVEAYAEERGSRLDGYGMATLQEEAIEAGIEPDEWYLTQPDGDPERQPDLAIEVVVTHGGINKLEIYRRFGVREVWFWVNGRIWIYHLDGETYVEAKRSLALPDVDLSELERIVASTHERTDQTAVIRAYRASLSRR